MAALSVDTILRFSNAQKIAAVGCITVALFCAYFFLVFKGAQEELRLKNDERTKLQAQYDEQQKILANLPKFKQELKDLQDELLGGRPG